MWTFKWNPTITFLKIAFIAGKRPWSTVAIDTTKRKEREMLFFGIYKQPSLSSPKSSDLTIKQNTMFEGAQLFIVKTEL